MNSMQHLVLLCSCLMALTVAAAPSKSTNLAKEADRLYKENKYLEAADKLRGAYDLEPLPLYLYNIARAYDQAGELDSSVDYYREYVGLPSDVSVPDLVRKANLAMDRLRTLMARRDADKKMSDDELKRLGADARRAEERADAEAEAARKQRREFEEKEKARKEAEGKTIGVRKIAAYATAGVAVVGYGLAIGFGIAATSNRESFRTSTTLEGKQRFEAVTRGNALVTDISLLVAIAATAATIIVYPKGTDANGSITLAFAPLIGGGGMASLGVSF